MKFLINCCVIFLLVCGVYGAKAWLRVKPQPWNFPQNGGPWATVTESKTFITGFCVHEGRNRYQHPLISISGQPCSSSRQLILKSPDEPLCCVIHRDLPRKKIIGQCQSFCVNLAVFVAQAWALSPGWYWTTQEWFQTPQTLLLLGWQHMSPFSH